MIEDNLIDPSLIVSYIGGLNCVPEVVGNFSAFGGGKKLIYPQTSLPLTAVNGWSVEKEEELIK